MFFDPPFDHSLEVRTHLQDHSEEVPGPYGTIHPHMTCIPYTPLDRSSRSRSRSRTPPGGRSSRATPSGAPRPGGTGPVTGTEDFLQDLFSTSGDDVTFHGYIYIYRIYIYIFHIYDDLYDMIYDIC